jgi:ribosomal protein S18 acetylase RimI-like enzyme
MPDLLFRELGSFPEPEFSALVREALADYQESSLLTDVLAQEASAGSSQQSHPSPGELRLAAFDAGRLVAWTYAKPQGQYLQMINSGVASAYRRRGVYSQLVQLVTEHAKSHGYIAVSSRHATDNNAVIIAKLRLGFFVSGFEYSEVYGPLVRLTCLLSEPRSALYRARAKPLRPTGDAGSTSV